MPKEEIKPFRRSLSIERSKEGIPSGYNSETRECDLSFSSEGDEVFRYADYSMREKLKANEYREILDHDNADFDYLRACGSLLRNHDPNQIIGSIISVENKDNRGIARVRFTSTQAGKDAETEVREGALKSTSFGYEHKPNGRIIPAGEKYTHHGRTYHGPAYIVGFKALEATLTPIPADSSTGVGRSKDGSLEVETMPDVAIKPEVRKYCRTTGVKNKLTRDEIEKIIAESPCDTEEVDAEVQLTINERSTSQTVNNASVQTVIQPLSRDAIKSITTRGRLANLSVDDISEVLDKAKDESDAANLILSHVEKRGKESGALGGSTRVDEGLDATDKAVKYVEGCLAVDFSREIFNGDSQGKLLQNNLRSGDGAIGKFREENDVAGPDEFDSYLKSFRDLNCKKKDASDLADVFLNAFGFDLGDCTRAAKVKFLFSRDCSDRVSYRTLGKEGKVKLFQRDNGSVAVSGTASFPFLFENIQTKALRRLYKRWAPTWQLIARQGSLPDFKRGSRIALSDAGSLLLVKENQQPLSANFSDEAEYLQLNKYARRYSFSWEDMVNDNIGGMARTTMSIARAVMRKPQELFCLDLMSNPTMGDGVALFDAAHGNSQTGVMGATAVNAMAVAMMKQTGKVAPQDTALNIGGLTDNLDISPSVWYGPPDVWYAASKIFNPAMLSQVASDGGAGAGANFFIGNVPGVGKMTFVAEPRLSNTSYANYSVAKYFMFADKRDIDTYEVAFLDGNSEPILTQRQDYQTLGLETVVTLPCVAKAIDWRGAQYSTGA